MADDEGVTKPPIGDLDPLDDGEVGGGSTSGSSEPDCFVRYQTPIEICGCQKASWHFMANINQWVCQCPEGTKGEDTEWGVPRCVRVASPSSSRPSPTTAVTASMSRATSANPSSATVAAGNPPSGALFGLPNQGRGDGLTPGAVAGVAIGCLVAGALIASLLMFFACVRGRRRRADENGHLDEKAGYADGSATVAAVSAALPPAASDDEILRAYGQLRVQTGHHVRTYYHGGAVDGDMLGTAALHGTANVTRVAAPALRALLLDPETRPPALHAYICSLVLSRASLDADPKTSFLPPEMAGAWSSLAASTPSDKSPLLSDWRAVTGALLKPRYDTSDDIAADDPRAPALRRAQDEADLVLQPFAAAAADPGDGPSREQDLAAILRAGARLGFLLARHPVEWRMRWDGGAADAEPPAVAESAAAGLPVYPRLLRVTDARGRRLAQPQMMVDREVAAVGG